MTSERRRPTVLGLRACLLRLALTACGGSADPAPAATPVPPADHRVPVEQLPTGWRASNAAGDGYRTPSCGVDMEPAAPVDPAQQLEGPGG